MPNYAVGVADVAAGIDTQTLINLFSTAAGGRGYIYDILVSSGDTPTDAANNFEVQRTTVVGAATGVIPVGLDPDQQASTLDGDVDHSTEPTETAATLMLAFSLNKRATFRWVAAPGGELVIPATTANGINIARRTSTTAYILDCTFHFRE